jgi:peroxiredoxin
VSFAIILAVSLLAVVSRPAVAGENAVQPAAFTNSAPPPEAAPVQPSKVTPGQRAPDFQYQSYDQLWQHLHNVLEHGDVLLVFGASDVDLRTLEREREILLRSGVTPLAVVERNERDVWASVRRLGLTFSLLSDPRGVIGSQYGVFDAGTGRSHSSWYVIDKKGKVRQSGTTMPQQSWPTVTALALGRSVPRGVQSASSR